jgi:hypothetical protein
MKFSMARYSLLFTKALLISRAGSLSGWFLKLKCCAYMLLLFFLMGGKKLLLVSGLLSQCSSEEPNSDSPGSYLSLFLLFDG